MKHLQICQNLTSHQIVAKLIPRQELEVKDCPHSVFWEIASSAYVASMSTTLTIRSLDAAVKLRKRGRF